ncbi:hypothetical protein ACVIHI_008439 [Bradyrhizobium sp. USDA 4524]|nr:hypothetical protein [Bradyrhizobium sp. USDA 4538]MCP1899200.1 hypothetical protein [Bradyrhizobium sp. USDA 4537]MCP1986688.1 hypothetical protein [Bradyrhizobium sp. USDA 4539]
MSAIELCRTAALGVMLSGAIDATTNVSATTAAVIATAQKCQSLVRAQWSEDRRPEILDTQYFHVVFTLTQPIAAIALQMRISQKRDSGFAN